MKLNLEFYNNQIEDDILENDRKIFDIINSKKDLREVLENDTSVNAYINLSNVQENLLSWYEFKNEATVLNIGADFGQLVPILSRKLSRVVLTEESLKKSEYMKEKFENLDNIELFCGKFEDIVLNEKFDYIVISNYLERHYLDETLNIVKKYLKEDGILLIAVNNKFGISNWKGKDNYNKLLGGIDSKTEQLCKHSIEKLIKKNNLKNLKFYYIFPEYKAPNLIYTDEYEMTVEDISRNFELNEEKETTEFKENEVLREILKDEKDKFNFFVNSFLVEISNEEIANDIKYITFTNYRVEDKQIETIIKSKKVIKKATNSESLKHIKEIFCNMQYFPKDKCKLLDRVSNDNVSIESDFINGKRLDEEIIFSQNIKNEFDEYKKIIFSNTLKYEDVKKELLPLFKNYEESSLNELNYLPYAFLDMIPKNCFKINNEYCFFDQEWMIRNLPAEYILYRAIRNTSCINCDELLKLYNIERFNKLFEDLEEFFRDEIINKNLLLNIFYRTNINKLQLINELENIKDEFSKKVMNQTAEIADKQVHIQNLEAIIKQKDEQLVIIRNSVSWKITKPFRRMAKSLKNFYGRIKKWLNK